MRKHPCEEGGCWLIIVGLNFSLAEADEAEDRSLTQWGLGNVNEDEER